MRNFTTYCGAPARCRRCGAFAVLNYLDPAPPCGECGGPVQFYNDPALQAPQEPASPPRRPLFDWRLGQQGETFLLPDTAYVCPRCAHFRLRFVQRGHWD